MRTSIVAALGAALFAAIASAQSGEELDARPATAAAQAWLATVDAQRYGTAWDAAAPLLQGAIERTRWEATIQEARGPLGAVNARKLRSATYARSLPGAPEGEYVVIQYATAFANRPLSIETVTPMKQADGTWKVAGYYIR